jgi:hypothetical protein
MATMKNTFANIVLTSPIMVPLFQYCLLLMGFYVVETCLYLSNVLE